MRCDSSFSAFEESTVRPIDSTWLPATPATAAIDSPFVAAASRRLYGPMLEAGVQIHHFNDGLLHAKTMTVDRDLAMIGSANLDRRSFELNFEVSLVVYDTDFASRPGVNLQQPRYNVLNLNLFSRRNRWGTAFSLSVRNVLNQSYEYPVIKGTRQSFPAAGRSYLMELRHTF